MKCWKFSRYYCELIYRNTTFIVLKEVQKTSITTMIRLCPVQFAPEFAPPPLELASPLPELASPPPELELSLYTELILDSLTTDINPLHVYYFPVILTTISC